ncbi:hypothetical protein GIB67_038428 [Kingdonia uniflora]|uniref:BHLH domain-containing protein n=1 Tax=Kingdonia uniflora TaxID=39325 RepID=A0A7J7NP15_9MAGN|nr:hypothetical protein GIB67_038428 [Kingdonia uniflora]
MCDKKEEDQGESSTNSQTMINNNIQGFQEQIFLQQQQYNASFPHEVSQVFPWTLPRVHAPVGLDPFHPSSSSSSYGLFYNNRRASSSSSLQFEQLRIISDSFGVQPGSSSSLPFGFQTELGKMSAQEMMDAKALAASKSHSEAERRRRERINNHLARLRSLLPSTTKTDKASLLAEVIQHVKELKRQTSQIAETSPIPTETDELTVDTLDEDGKFIIKASICCEDRPDLLPDLIKTLKSLRLRTLKAEITTLGGRVKNVLYITGEELEEKNIDQVQEQQQQQPISAIQEALKAVMERTSSDDTSSGSIKRQRTNLNMLDHNGSL